MQKRFTHIVNHLASLGKIFPNEDLINKVLRCLSRQWQPKVTAIAESRDLTNMSLATLFGKLQEHEIELMRHHQHEENDKKRKGIVDFLWQRGLEWNRRRWWFQIFCEEIQQISVKQRKSKEIKYQSKEERRRFLLSPKILWMRSTWALKIKLSCP